MPLRNGRTPAGLVSPETLDVGEHRDDLLVAELLAERGHTALEIRQAGAFQHLPAVLDVPVQEAVRVMPGVTVAIERRSGKYAFGVGYVPVGLALA